MRLEFTKATKPSKLSCSAVDCGRPGRGNSDCGPLCGKHFQRWAKYGTPSLPQRALSPDGKCTAAGCGNPVRSGNAAYCEPHYYRLRRGSSGGLAPIREVCLQCSKALEKNQSHYCSALCGVRHSRGTLNVKSCIMCGAPFETSGVSKTCSPRCRLDAQHLHSHKRRAIIRGANAEVFAATEIFARDRWVCQLCHKRTLKNAKGRHPLQPSLDHIVPIAKGGDHTRANTQCVHLQCNTRKQAQIIGQMRLFG